MISQTLFFSLVLVALNVNAIRLSDNGVIKSVAQNAAPDMPGGKTVANITKFNDYERVARLAQEAIKQMDEKSDDQDVHFLIWVKEAARSVVAGVMHELVFYFGECQTGTRQLTNEPLAIRDDPNPDGVEHKWIVRPVCTENPSGTYGICWAEVLEQPWLNNTQLMDEERRTYVCRRVPWGEALKRGSFCGTITKRLND